jgi:hypothetical protein
MSSMRGCSWVFIAGVVAVWSGCESTGMEVNGATDAATAGADAGTPADASIADTAGADTASPVQQDTPPPADSASAVCAFDRSYEFYRDGGLRLYQDRSKLTPPRQYALSRDRYGGAPPATCIRILACETVTAISSAIAHPDVLEAMKQPTRPHYGGDPRPVDGTVFMFVRDDGRGFIVGPGTVPAGVRALEELLLKVAMESLAAPECAGLK